MKYFKNIFLVLVIIFFVANSIFAQEKQTTFFTANKKTSPDYFTIFITSEKEKEFAEIFSGKFPNYNLLYSEFLKLQDTIIEKYNYLFHGKKTSVYKKKNKFFVKFTGYENEELITELTPSSVEKTKPDILRNCANKHIQVSNTFFKLDSILGKGNYATDYIYFNNEKMNILMINLPNNIFKDTLNNRTNIFLKNKIKQELIIITRLKKMQKSITELNSDSIKTFLSKVSFDRKIEQEILLGITHEKTDLLVEILDKDNENLQKICTLFQKIDCTNEIYNLIYNSLKSLNRESKAKNLLLRSLKKGIRKTKFSRIATLTGEVLLILTLPASLLLLININN